MLQDKIIIVTGGCSGIGWGITQVCAKHGATVIAAQRSESGRKRVDRLSEQGRSVFFERLDVSDAQSINAFVAKVMHQHGKIDALINNAGITIEEDFFDFPLEKLDLLWATNQRSIFLMSQTVGRHMRDAGQGSIVNVSSNHSHASVPGYEMYAATKGGISAMGRAMSWSLGAHGIRVNTLSPGLTMTESVADVMETTPGLENAFRDLHALNEVASVEEVANVAAFLASDLSSAITGADIIADKGTHAQLCRTDDLK